MENNEICADFLKKLAFITLRKDVEIADLLNEGLDRAKKTLGIYWAKYPDAGGAAFQRKIGHEHEKLAEIWFSDPRDLSNPLQVVTFLHEVFHVGARAGDIELSQAIKSLGIEVLTDFGTKLDYPTDEDNRNYAYSGYWGQALKNHCGQGTINRRVVPK